MKIDVKIIPHKRPFRNPARKRLPAGVAHLAVPVGAYHTARYTKAMRLIAKRRPDSPILSPTGAGEAAPDNLSHIWTDNESRLARGRVSHG